jgi:16S rRNA (cytosine967-C5)-methyltransferase
MSPRPEVPAAAAWPTAARLIARWLDRRERIDVLLDTLPRSLAGGERARCQHLVLGVVRHFGRIDAALARLVAHPPRFSTRAVLFVAGYELLEATSATADPRAGHVAKIVHHAVEQTKALASPAEARLVNAVVRKLAGVLPQAAPGAGADAGELAEYFSHPDWLVRSWLAQFGPEATRALLEWNQRPAPVYARWRPPVTRASAISADAADAPPRTAGAEARPDFLKPTSWPDMFEVESGRWPEVEPLLKSGKIYLQDPATRLPIDLLGPKPGESVLDLCAAPGGKSLMIADRMRPAGTAAATGQLVAVDLPGPRIERLKSNLAWAEGVNVALVQADLLENLGPVLREHRLPFTYDAVLIDVPCSNTGVMRHRVDVKWRLQAGDFKKHPRQQLSLLHAAARFVASGGRLVYSTCSIDAEENEHVIAGFFASRAGEAFSRESSVASLPWVTGHDGGAAFLLRRKA